MFREFVLIIDILDNILDLLKVYSVARWNKTIKVLWVCVVWVVLWGIWKERKSRIFNDQFASVFDLWDKILFWVVLWIKSRQDFRHILLSDLSMGWSFLL